MQRRQYLATVGTVSLAALAGCQDSGNENETNTESIELPFERTVDPSRTYLRVSGDDAGDAQPVDLSSLGVSGGLSVSIERLGSFTGSSSGTGMSGVFSASATLASPDQRERVADALDAGDDYETAPTFNGNNPTDIPEDFLIADNDGSQTSVTVTVPDGATHLFVAAIDNLYEDNGQGETEFAVRIEQA